MPEIIDMLTTKVDEGAQFTVNNAVASVDLTSVTGLLATLYAAENVHRFTRGDNFTVLSVGYFLPDNFVIYGYEDVAGVNKFPFPVMNLRGLLSVSGPPAIPIFSFGNLGQLRIPFPNFEMSVGTFCDTESNTLDEDFDLQVDFPYDISADRPQVSMTGVPAALNGITFRVIPFVKVLHNIALA